MVLHDTEAEKPFAAPFDGRFPYDDPSASALIRQGWAISLNAAFCVLHELCRPPHRGVVGKERLRELVTEWATGPDHPLKAPLLHAARALIENTPLPWREGVELMRSVGEYDAQRAALAIAYFASDCDSQEGDDALALTDAEIRQRWEAKGVQGNDRFRPIADIGPALDEGSYARPARFLTRFTPLGNSACVTPARNRMKDGNMVALVTGGTGFLGSKVVRALIENGQDKVVAFDLYPNETNLAGVLDSVEIVRGDLSSFTTILNLIETHKPEKIYHLGALLGPSETDPEAGIRVNALGTYYLLEAARLFGVSQMVFASSITVISSTDPQAQSLHDFSPTHPETVYGATKLFSENLGRYYRRQHGFDFRGIRLPSVIGPGVKQDGYVQYFNKTIELSAKGSPFELYVRPDTRLPVVHVDDAAEAFLHLAAAPTERVKAVIYAIMGPCPSPSAQELVDLVTSKIPGARLNFKVDEYVQRMFDGILRLPLDDRYARQEWDWKPRFELEAIIDDFISNVQRQSAEDPAL